MNEQKQVAVRMNTDEVKELKQFCLDNDLTITDAVKSGLELLKGAKNVSYNDETSFYTIQISKEYFEPVAGNLTAKFNG